MFSLILSVDNINSQGMLDSMRQARMARGPVWMENGSAATLTKRFVMAGYSAIVFARVEVIFTTIAVLSTV